MKLNMQLSYDLAITLNGIYPREVKIYVYTETCTQMFTAAVVIIVKKVETTQISFNKSINSGTSL